MDYRKTHFSDLSGIEGLCLKRLRKKCCFAGKTFHGVWVFGIRSNASILILVCYFLPFSTLLLRYGSDFKSI
jgi:hypothetical protein